MKDEVLELLAPDTVERYKRWRSWLVGAEVVAALSAVVGLGLVVFDGSCAVESPSEVLFVAGAVITLARVLFERFLTKSVSTIGMLFSTRPRMALVLVWLVCFSVGSALHRSHFVGMGGGSLGPSVVCFGVVPPTSPLP